MWVLNLHNFTILPEHFLKCSKSTPTKSEFKTSRVSNKSENPNLVNVILILHTSIHGSTRTLVIPLTVANIKCNILVKFVLKNVKRLNIEHVSFTFNSPHESHGYTLPSTARKVKDRSYSSYKPTIKVKNKAIFKLNAFQVIHIPIQPTLPLTLKTSENKVICCSTSHHF